MYHFVSLISLLVILNLTTLNIRENDKYSNKMTSNLKFKFKFKFANVRNSLNFGLELHVHQPAAARPSPESESDSMIVRSFNQVIP